MVTTTVLRRGLISAYDYRCDAGPDAAPFVEQHSQYAVAYVRSGSFGYRTRGKAHELVTGALLIGHPGDEYMCTHEYVCGDECFSFHLAPELVDSIGAPELWRAGSVPPLPQLMVLGELAQAAATGATDIGLDEVGIQFAARFTDTLAGKSRKPARRNAADRRRAVEVALWIAAHSHEVIGLEHAAREAGLSPFHFLRLFSGVLGVTPHQ